MKEYIDREALIEKIAEGAGTWGEGLGRSWWSHSVMLKDNFVRLIREAPEEDVVEVVRCNDCKYCKAKQDYHGNGHWHCTKAYGFPEVDPLDFCSYGRREQG